MSQKCPSWAIILLSYSKVIYDHGKAKIWGSKEGPSACIMASHTVSVWVYPLSHWIIHLLIQSFNNISTLIMPPHCIHSGANTKSEAWDRARGKDRQMWEYINIIDITVNLNGIGKQRREWFPPKHRSSACKCLSPHKIPIQKSHKVRLQHRSTDKIAIRKNLTRSISSKSKGYKYEGQHTVLVNLGK